MRKSLYNKEHIQIEAKLGPSRRNGKMAHILLRQEHPLLFEEIHQFTYAFRLSLLQYSRLAYYCLAHEMAEDEIVPMLREVYKQAGRFYKAVAMEMAEQWNCPHVIERILTAQPYRG